MNAYRAEEVSARVSDSTIAGAHPSAQRSALVLISSGREFSCTRGRRRICAGMQPHEVMTDMQDRAKEFRRHAASCVRIAERMSIRENRDRVMEIAQQFLQLAQKEDAKAE